MSLNKILSELRSWREGPSRRERLWARQAPKEVPNPVPVALPVGYDTPPTMTELIQRYVRQEVSQAASADHMGTFAEEDDFSEDDEEQIHFPGFELNEFQMEADPDMPSTAPVDDPPPEVPEGDADPSPIPGDEPKPET